MRRHHKKTFNDVRRRAIVGVAVDVISIDRGQTEKFESHVILVSAAFQSL
jgi:hypothetical protein